MLRAIVGSHLALVLWLLGLGLHIAGGLIHILVLVAIVRYSLLIMLKP